MRLRLLIFLLLAMLAAPAVAQHRVTRIVSPQNANDDPSTTDLEVKSNTDVEVHLDEDDATDAASHDSEWALYDGANGLMVRFSEGGPYEIGTNDIVRGSGSATWGPAFWATTTSGTTVCSNQGLTCVNTWNLGVGADTCASTANPRVVYCQ